MAVESALRVEVVAPSHGDWAPALRLALTGNRASHRDGEEAVRSFVAFATSRGLAVPPILVHRRGGKLVTACVALESPGATAMVFVPPAAGSADADAATIALLRELQRRAWERSLVVLQALLEPKEKENARIVAEAGFE